MPYCTHCKQEYPEGTTQCPECHRDLQLHRMDWLPYDPKEPLVDVRTVQGELAAVLLQGQLEQKGIPVVLQRESLGLVYGLTVDGLGAQRLLVPESLLRKAKWALVCARRRGAWPRRRRSLFTRKQQRPM